MRRMRPEPTIPHYQRTGALDGAGIGGDCGLIRGIGTLHRETRPHELARIVNCAGK